MLVRIICTGAVLLVAAVAFLGYGPAPAGLNAPGVAFCIGAAIIWFGWPRAIPTVANSRRRDGKRPDLVTIGAAPLLTAEPDDSDADEPHNRTASRP